MSMSIAGRLALAGTLYLCAACDAAFDMAEDPALAELEAELESSEEPPEQDTPPFREKWVSERLNALQEIVVGSLDRDHKVDIVGSSFASSGAQITVFERRGVEYAPVFTDVAVGQPSCAALAIGDTDGDCAAEIICGVTIANRIRIFEATGDDTYVERATNIDEQPPDNRSVEQVHVADLDQDGREEIIFSMDGGTFGAGSVVIYEHDGAADGHNFVKLFDHEISTVQFHFTVGDGDNDGRQEIIYGRAGPALDRIQSTGDDTFEVKSTPEAIGGLLGGTVADVDLDGDNELVFAGGSGIRILEHTGEGEFQIVYSDLGGMNGNSLVADARVARGSPYPLLAIGSHGGSAITGQIWFWRYNGEIYERLDDLAIEGVGGDIRDLAFANLDDDFRPDLVYTLNGTPATIHVLEQRN